MYAQSGIQHTSIVVECLIFRKYWRIIIFFGGGGAKTTAQSSERPLDKKMLDTGIFLTRKFDKSQTASLVKWNNSLRSFFFKCCIKLKQCLKARFLPAQIDNKTSSIKGKLIDVPCGKWCCPPLSPPTIHLDFSTLYFKPLHSKI